MLESGEEKQMGVFLSRTKKAMSEEKKFFLAAKQFFAFTSSSP